MRPLERLLFMQGGECFFCRKPLAETDASIEHLLAKSKKGGDHSENCVACCKSLNALLGDMSVKQKFQIVLNQKGQFACPNGVQRKVTKTDHVPVKPKLAADRYSQVVADLKRRGTTKPRTIATLENTIAAVFKKKLRPDEVKALVQELQSRRFISITAGSKINYTQQES